MGDDLGGEKDRILTKIETGEVLAKSKLNDGLCAAHKEAIRLFKSGEKPCYSTGVCDQLTCGYGVLDKYGYWEFPLPAKYWEST